VSDAEERAPQPNLPAASEDRAASLNQGMPEPNMMPWEQRAIVPDEAGRSTPSTAPAAGGAITVTTGSAPLALAITDQASLRLLATPARHTVPMGDLAYRATDNADLWGRFLDEELYDTRRLTLEQFHLFEWYPLSPGRFHTDQGQQLRTKVYQALARRADGTVGALHPAAKGELLAGGFGAVRLRPRSLDGEDYYFMTASSSRVCHEGFPVLVPRRFYGQLKPRLNAEGAVPATLRGEMRYIDADTVAAVFGARRDVPMLYLHVEELEVLPDPRPGGDGYLVSVAAAFYGAVDNQTDAYVTFASFDPAQQDGLERASVWLEEFYVRGLYGGTVITDFDEVRPQFPNAVFGLPYVMAGRIDKSRARQVLVAAGLAEDTDVTTIVNNFGDVISVGDVTGGTVAVGRGAQAGDRSGG
jgi:hypothetical protein